MSGERRNALSVGTEFEGYRIDGVLGAGGFGITYVATEVLLNRKVAIKEFLPSGIVMRENDGISIVPIGKAEEDEYAWGIERFRTEAQTLVAFAHPNIVRVHRYFETNRTGYLVMEFVSGETLAHRLMPDRTLTEDEIHKVADPLLDGLQAVHDQGFLHRDIKPANILIGEDDAPILIDFGAARQALGQHSKSLTAIISEGYAPYEQYDSSGEQGTWTDIYAFGGVLYRCVTGVRPPDAPSRVSALVRGGDDPLQPAELAAKGDYSDALLGAINSSLAIREDERPQTIGDLRLQMTPTPVAGTGAAEAVSDALLDAAQATPEGVGDHTLFAGDAPAADEGAAEPGPAMVGDQSRITGIAGTQESPSPPAPTGNETLYAGPEAGAADAPSGRPSEEAGGPQRVGAAPESPAASVAQPPKPEKPAAAATPAVTDSPKPAPSGIPPRQKSRSAAKPAAFVLTGFLVLGGGAAIWAASGSGLSKVCQEHVKSIEGALDRGDMSHARAAVRSAKADNCPDDAFSDYPRRIALLSNRINDRVQKQADARKRREEAEGKRQEAERKRRAEEQQRRQEAERKRQEEERRKRAAAIAAQCQQFGRSLSSIARNVQKGGTPELMLALIGRAQRAGCSRRQISGMQRTYYFAKGYHQTRIKDYMAALRSYNTVIKLGPGGAAHNNRGHVLLRLRQYNEALADFDAAIRYNSRRGLYHANRAIVLFRLGRKAEAIQAIETAVRLTPGNQGYLRLRRLMRGRTRSRPRSGGGGGGGYNNYR